MNRKKFFSRRGVGHSVNQDAGLILDKGVVSLYAVCDGHGDLGHRVAHGAACRIAKPSVAYIMEAGGFGNVQASKSALKDFIYDLDVKVGREVKESAHSGCTLAAAVIDTDSRKGYLYGAGDSLAIAYYNNTPLHLPLQNMSMAPRALLERFESIERSTGKQYMGENPGGTLYVVNPDGEDALQLYSCLGDFDMKKQNPLVFVRPSVEYIPPSQSPTVVLLASDGYAEGLAATPCTQKWFAEIKKEIEECRGSPEELVKMAQDRGSGDDISAIVFTV